MLQLQFAIVSLLLLGTAYCQVGDLTCSLLGVGRDGNPFSGLGLSVCSTSDDQCCTQEFVDRLTREVREDLLNGLREQITGRMDGLRTILNNVGSFLDGDFVMSIKDALPGTDFIGNAINTVTQRLSNILNRNNFAISSDNPEFNTTQVFVDLIDSFEDAVRGIIPGSLSCVEEHITSSINRTAIVALGRSLESLRRSFTAFTRIITFLVNFASDLDGFSADSFPTECVERAIEVAFCGRCKARIPPLCSNTCGSLVRGCFSGFYSGLEGEFNNLWNVLSQVIRTVDGAVREIIFQEGRFFHFDATELARECGIPRIPGVPIIGRKKRQIPNFLPEGLVEGVVRLARTGVFVYGPAPLLCAVEAAEEVFCSSRSGGGDRSCDDNVICTSLCQCWDGEQMRDTDTTLFEGNGIEDQESNPVLVIPEDVNTAIATARSTVVTSFLTSQEFEEIRPETVTVPPPAGFGGGVAVTVSMATTLVMLLFALCFM